MGSDQFLIFAYLFTLVILEHPMMHIKIQGHRPFGSGEEVFLFRFLPYMGMAAILVM